MNSHSEDWLEALLNGPRKRALEALMHAVSGMI